MLKTTESSELALGELRTDEVVGDGGKADDRNPIKKSKNAKSRSQTRIGATRELTFLTPGTKKALNQLKQAFTKAPILQHFDPECHIRIEADASGYAIGGVLSQLTPDQVTLDSKIISTKSDSGQWHPVAYFFRKMISAETHYETHNCKLLAIVEAFKTWKHYLKSCKHKILVLPDHNNYRQFMDTKSLSSRQVWWA